jgi:hypothetical protein
MPKRKKIRVKQERIDALLLARIDNGESAPMRKEDWARIRAEGRRRFLARRGKAV